MDTHTPNTQPAVGIAALMEAIDVFDGSQTKLSRAVGGDSTQLVNNWIRRNNVPAEWCPHIEEVTAAKGRPVVCERLRPDVRWYVLRGKRRPAKRSGT